MSETPPTYESTPRLPSAWPGTLLTTPEEVGGLRLFLVNCICLGLLILLRDYV